VLSIALSLSAIFGPSIALGFHCEHSLRFFQKMFRTKAKNSQRHNLSMFSKTVVFALFCSHVSEEVRGRLLGRCLCTQAYPLKRQFFVQCYAALSPCVRKGWLNQIWDSISLFKFPRACPIVTFFDSTENEENAINESPICLSAANDSTVLEISIAQPS
jgi:hypothetical protein